MRIVFITNSIGFGGVEKNVGFVANGLSDRGHNVCIVNFNSIGEYINENQTPISERIKVHTFHTTSKSKITRLQKIWFATKIVKKNRADVMVCFTTFPSYAGKVVSLLTGIPSIMSERGNPYKTINKKNLPSLIELMVVNKSAGGVFQIQGAANFFSKGLQKRAVIIPNPIFVKDKVEPVVYHEREKCIVSVGRLDNEQKRYDIMIKAFAIFGKQYPEWKLKLYGKGPDLDLIKKYCIDEGVADKVMFMGLSKHPMTETNKAGMFLITSDYEGISNALLEAMAIGLPCVSSDSEPGGARMLIDNMKNGILAPVGDPEKIANAMALFACNPHFAAECGERAKDVLKRFEPTLTLDKWENYLTKIVKKSVTK